MRGSAAHGGGCLSPLAPRSSFRARPRPWEGARCLHSPAPLSQAGSACPGWASEAWPRTKGCREGGRRAGGAGSHWGDGLQHRRWRLPCANVEKKRALWPLPPPPTQPHARAPHHHPSARPACRPPPSLLQKCTHKKGNAPPAATCMSYRGVFLRAASDAYERRARPATAPRDRPAGEAAVVRLTVEVAARARREAAARRIVCVWRAGAGTVGGGEKKTRVCSPTLCERADVRPPIFHSPPHSRPRSHPTPHAPRPLPARPPTHPPPCPWNRRAAAACQTHATTPRPRTRRTRRRRTPPRAVGQSWSPSPSRPRRPARGRRPGPSGGRCPAPWASNCSGRRRCS